MNKPNLAVIAGTDFHPTYWLSPVPPSCQLCHRDFNGQMFDARVRTGGWANTCADCHRRYCNGLGEGRGQRYTLVAGGRWLKTGG